MKAIFVFLAATFSATAFANAAAAPTAWLSKEAVTCARGNESLSVQILSNAHGDPNQAIGVFVDYKRAGVSIYSSSSFGKPSFVPAGAGGYMAEGYGADAGKTLNIYTDYMTSVVRLEGMVKGRHSTILAMEGCKNNGQLGMYTNIGTPIIDPVPVKKKSPPKRKEPYRKI